IEEIAAAARTGARSKRRLEEFGREFDDIVQALAALLLLLRLARHHRQRNAGLLRQPLDGFREAHAFGQHEKIENVAVLGGGEVKPHRLMVIDEERWLLLLVEGRQPLPFAAGLAQFHAPADDLRNRKPRPQLVEKLRRKSHGDSRILAPWQGEARWQGRRTGKAAPCPGYPQQAAAAICHRHAQLYAGHLA